VTFRLGSIPVRVTLWFVLVSIMFGTSGARTQPVYVALWVAVVFVSVLVHELGHALMGRAFGLEPQIELHGMGGTTSWASGRDVGPWKSVAISLAGPFAGFAFGGLVFFAEQVGLSPKHELAKAAMEQLLFVNIFWGVINLVPMLPLDGGNVMRSVLNGITKGRGEKASRIVSIVIAGLLVLFALKIKWIYGGFIGALFAFSNIQALRAVGRVETNAPLAEAIEQSYAALEKQDGATAIALLRPALANGTTSPQLYQIGLRLFAYSLLIEGHWRELMPLLEREHAVIGKEELSRYARTARELGRQEEADRIEALAPA
jgi:Zn-dependent protease